MTCDPVIGIILSDGSITQIGYMPIMNGKIPKLELVIQIMEALTAFIDVETGDLRTSVWACENPLTDPERKAWGTSHD